MTDSKLATCSNKTTEIEKENEKLVESLKHEIGKMKDSQLDIFKNALDNCTKQCIKELSNKMDLIRHKLNMNAEGKELYDYSQMAGRETFYVCCHPPCYNNQAGGNRLHSDTCSNNKNVDLKEFLTCFKSECTGNCPNKNHPSCTVDNIKKFINFVKDEKVIYQYANTVDKLSSQGTQGTIFFSNTLLTNYGRIIKFCNMKTPAWSRNEYKSEYFEHNFWIPIDYICLLSLIDPEKIDGYIGSVKSILYNRAFIPLYLTDIIKENNELKDKYAKNEKEHKKFLEDKEKFEKDMKPWLDLKKEKDELAKLKNKLTLYSKKLSLEKAQLEIDKKKLETIDVKELDKL